MNKSTSNVLLSKIVFENFSPLVIRNLQHCMKYEIKHFYIETKARRRETTIGLHYTIE